MADPFQNVDAAGDDFIAAFADSMDARQSDPAMEEIVAAYLDRLAFPKGSLTVEVGCGAGAVTRRIAERARPERVIGYEPSTGFVAEARKRVTGYGNVAFEVADGAALPLDDGAADNVILHTVLTHVTEPAALLAEAARVVTPGGRVVVCDNDFAKASLASFSGDPLDICARLFCQEFVTDAHLVGKLPALVSDAGLAPESFDLKSRLVRDNEQMLRWVEETCKLLIARGDMGEALRDGLVAEYRRRMEEGSLYGYQVFATMVAVG